MINIRTIRKIENNGGLTLKNGKIINYKSGWQVADNGVAVTTAEECIKAVKEMKGNCGVWLENGIYYVDHSFRVNTKKEALEIGRKHNQISVLNWKKMTLAYCQGSFFCHRARVCQPEILYHRAPAVVKKKMYVKLHKK